MRARSIGPAVVLTIALALAGCTALGHSEPVHAGAAPSNPEAAVKAYLGNTLKDPYSVRDLTVGTPSKASCNIGVYGQYWAWRVPVSFNAKNSFGAYVGIQRFYYWFRGESLRGITQDAGFCPTASGW